jgi:hypothetical protein
MIKLRPCAGGHLERICWRKGDQLSVDHIISRAVVPELDNVIANLAMSRH